MGKFVRHLGMAVFLFVSPGSVLAHGTHSSLMHRVDERLAREPENAGLWYQRAVLEYEHEDWAGAAMDFAKVAQFAPGEFPVLWWQGRILDEQGKPAEAKAALDAFLATKPNHWEALASRARVREKLGENDKSLDDFRAAMAHNPKAEPDLIQEVAQAFASGGRQAEAIEVLQSGLNRLGSIPSLQLKILELEVNAAAYDAALARLGAMQASASRPEPWMEKRASILAQAGRLDESRAAWRSLICHLNALPPAERNSHAMTLFSERAHQALLVLSSATSLPSRSPIITSTPSATISR